MHFLMPMTCFDWCIIVEYIAEIWFGGSCSGTIRSIYRPRFILIMGAGEMGTPPKTTKTSTLQEQPPTSTAMLYPDWAAAFQAYYNSGTAPPPPPAYFHSSVASSPQPHPYIWGGQPLMPPYGTLPPPYAAMYHHGGMYAHPSMPPGAHPFAPYVMTSSVGTIEAAPVGTTSGADAEGKSSELKDQSLLKRSKGSLGSLNMLTGKINEGDKGTGGGGNGTLSLSGESGSEGSSERSDETSQNGSQATQKKVFELNSAKAADAQNANTTSYNAHGGSAFGASGAQAANSTVNLAIAAVPISIAGKSSTVAGSKTNLNIGMDYWSGSTTATSTMRGKRPAVPRTTAMVPAPQSISLMVPCDGVPAELWDEREIKRQRRKQSNRESARRSRLRKQAECEELAKRVEVLKAENTSLRTELNQLEEAHKKLSTENSFLYKKLRKNPEEETRDTKSEKDGDAGTGEQLEQQNEDTGSGAVESMQRDGRREETSFNLDGRNRPLDNRNQAVSVSAG